MLGHRVHIGNIARNCRGILVKIAGAGALLGCLGGISQRACAIVPDTSVTRAVVCEPDSVSAFRQTIYFPVSTSTIDVAFRENPSALDSIRRFFSAIDSARLVDVVIEGSASPEGSKAHNVGLAKKRAQTLSDFLKFINAVPDVPVSVSWGVVPGAPCGMWENLRSAGLTVRMIPERPQAHEEIPGCETAGGDTLAVAGAGISETASCEMGVAVEVPGVKGLSDEPEVTAPSEGRIAVPFLIKTNLLYDAALVPNLGVGICIADRLTVYADWMHAWWSNHPDRRYWRVYGGDIDVSWQLGHGKSDNLFSGHRVGVYASMVTYDFQFGRNRTGVIGDKYNYAVGLSYGYSLPVARRLNIDFGIGIGYMWGRYMKHHVIDDHDVWQSTNNRRWFGPTRVEIGLTWLIGRGNVNNKREGGRK